MFLGNRMYTVVILKMPNSFPSMSLSILSTVKQKKINDSLTSSAFSRNDRCIFIMSLGLSSGIV